MADEIDKEVESLFASGTPKHSNYERKDKAEERRRDREAEAVSQAPKPPSDFFGGVGKAFQKAVVDTTDKYFPDKEARQKNVEDAARESGKSEMPFHNDDQVNREVEDLYGGSNLPLSAQKYDPFKKSEIVEVRHDYDTGERTKGGLAIMSTGKEAYGTAVELYNQKNKEIQDAEWKKVGQTLNPISTVIGAKGYLSEAKLKLEASKYGITPENFEAAKAKGKLNEVRYLIDQGRGRELAQKQAEAYRRSTLATAKANEAQAAQRYAKADQAEAQVGKGGRKLVSFGHAEGSFGEGQPIYLNQQGSHGSVRAKFLPGKATGVSTSLASSRLEIAKMKNRVLGGVNQENSGMAVQLLQPHSNVVGLPSTVSRLASTNISTGQGGIGTISKLSPFGKPRFGPSALSKLSVKKKP